MARTPDNGGEDRRFPFPPTEGARRIDVISNAETIIIPALRRLASANAHLASQVGEENRAPAREAFIDIARARLVLPLWGSMEKMEIGLEESADEQTIVRKELSGQKGLLEGSRGVSLSGSAVLGYEIVMKCAQSPRVTDSLIVGRTVFYSSSNNNSAFVPEQLDLMTRLTNGLREADDVLVLGSLRGLSEHVDPMDHQHYKYDENAERYRQRFGELGEVAYTVDKLYVPLLTGSETRDVFIDNSVIFANSAMPNVLGGTIRNSIIASNYWPLKGAHVDLENVIVVSELGEMRFKEGSYGDSRKAKAAVDAVKDLPPSPLLSFVKQFL